ncbi:MAG TPA: YbhB/YbcL family Raf kinase inhibitor-like protein [Candidatus Baltobacteraceae bacterium]
MKSVAAALLFASVIALARPAAADGSFVVTSPAFHDGDLAASTYADKGLAVDNTSCGGEGVSPPLQWTNVPDGTQSFALVIFDVDARGGAGVVHWVAYNMAATKTSVTPGEGAPGGTTLTGGTNTAGTTQFHGFCPPKGDAPHHYVMTIFALDLPPTLTPGLTRDDLLAAMKHHVLRLASVVARYGR